MSGNFKVGEVLVGQNYIRDTHRNEMECTVIAGLEIRAGRYTSGEVSEPAPKYRVQWVGGTVGVAKPFNLRRKQPPAGEQSVLDMFKLPAPSKEVA